MLAPVFLDEEYYMSKKVTKLITTDIPNNSPVLVEAEAMFEKLAEITKQTAAKAYDFFVERGSRFGTHLEDWLNAEAMVLRPTPVEITETADTVSIKAAVPGFKANEIEISVKDKDLILSGETSFEEKKEEENAFYSEWRSNRFFRQLTLPANVEAEGAGASLKDGVLFMSLKKKAAEGAVKVSVKAA